MYSHQFRSRVVSAACKSKAVGHISVTTVPLLFICSGLQGPLPGTCLCFTVPQGPVGSCFSTQTTGAVLLLHKPVATNPPAYH